MADYNLGRAHGVIDIDYNGAGAREADADMKRVQKSSKDTDRELTKLQKSNDDTGASFTRLARSIRDLRTVGTALASIAKVLIIPALAIGLVTASAQAVSATLALGQALVEASAAAGAAVPVVLALVAAFAALKIGMAGVTDAFKAQFDIIVKHSAGLKVSAADIEKYNEALAKLSPSAQAFVRAFERVGPLLRTLQLDVQDKLFRDLGTTVDAFADSTLPALQVGLVSIAAGLNKMALEAATVVNSPMFGEQLKVILGNTSTAFHTLAGAVGPVLNALTGAATALSPLIINLSNAATAWLKFHAAQLLAAASSGSLLARVEHGIDVLKQLGRIALNAGGILKNIFAGLTGGAGAGTFLDTLEQISARFKDITSNPAVIDSITEVFRAAASVGKPFLQFLGLLLRSIGSLIPTIVQLGQVVSTSLIALLPAVIPLLKAIGQALIVATPFIGQFAAILATTLTGAIRALTPILPVLGAALIQVAGALGGALVSAIQQIAPILPALIKALADLLIAIVPILPALLPTIVALLKLATAVLPLLTQAVQFIIPIIAAFAHINSFLIGVLTALVPILGIVLGAILGLERGFAHFLAFLGGLVGKAVGFIAGMATSIAGWLSRMTTNASVQAATLVNRVVGFLATLPGRAAGAIAGIVSAVNSKIVAAANAAFRGASSLVSGVAARLAGLAGRVASALSSIPGQITGILASAAAAAFGAAARIPAQIAAGILSGISKVREAAGRLASAVGKVLPGSPVEEGPLKVLNNGYAGRQIARMLADGLAAGERIVAAAANSLAASAMPQLLAGVNGATLSTSLGIGTAGVGALTRPGVAGPPTGLSGVSARALEGLPDAVGEAIRHGLSDARLDVDSDGFARLVIGQTLPSVVKGVRR